MSSVSQLGPTYLGLDVHKDAISVAILAPDRDGPDVERIAHDEASLRRRVGRLGDPCLLRACGEPTQIALRITVRCSLAWRSCPSAGGPSVDIQPSQHLAEDQIQES